MTAQILDAQTLNHTRVQDLSADLSQQLADGLSRPAGQKEMPTVLLYDERGLRLYDDITTHVSEYYLFGAEEEILKNNADEIIHAMHPGVQVPEDETVLELGAGSLRKTSQILAGLSRLVPSTCETAPITYYALDLEHRELQRCLDSISNSSVGKMLQGKVDTKGLCGTYEDGLKFIESAGYSPSSPLSSDSPSGGSDPFPGRIRRTSSSSGSVNSASSSSSSAPPPSTPASRSGSNNPLHILFLGSSLGNFGRSESVKFLQSLPLRPGSGDTLLIGLDHDNDKALIEEAYNDRMGYTKRFIMNGLRAAGRALGDEKMFDEDKWEYVNQYNEAERRHEAYYKSKSNQTFKDPNSLGHYDFLKDELVKIEVSYKYSDRDAYSLFTDSGLRPIQRWTDSATQYSLWLVERPPFMFPLLKSPVTFNGLGEMVPNAPISSTPFGVPSPQEWANLWAAWDFVTLKMIPPSMLFVKPIHLRHICLFYFGHIPTFLDIHLSRLLNEPHTEPENFKDIFERGIDPNVDNPEECHPHSEVPQKDEDWPSLQDILQFQSRVRERLLNLYSDISSGRIALTRTIGRVLFMVLEHEAFHLETLLYMLLQVAGNGALPPTGFTPPPWKSLAANWNSAPKLSESTTVLGPETITLGIDDSEDQDKLHGTDVNDHVFGWDNESPKREVHVAQFRIEWRPVTNGQFLQFYQDHREDKNVHFPASWVEKDGETMVRTLYGPVHMNIAQDWPVVTSYDNLSAYAVVKGGRLPTEPELRLFYDKFESGYEGGANVGFRNWHPVPATMGGATNGGKGHNGGVWEWTSTVLEKHDGFVPSERYPGFTADFFDGCHNIILGGSYANIPRMTERRSLRNWYQRNYPYAWTGGRIVYDL